MKFEAALFDLDGVLIDTEGGYTGFWNRKAAEFGKPSTFAYDIKGSTLTTILNTHFPKELHRDLVKAIHMFEEEMPYLLFPGVMDFIDSLALGGIPMAIVTSSDDKKMEALEQRLPGLTAKMNVIVNGSQVTNSKPHPEGYLTAASKLGVDPRQCMVFEDSLQGLEAGRRAGSRVIGLATTNSIDKVKPLCDIVLTSWKGVTPQQLGFNL